VQQDQIAEAQQFFLRTVAFAQLIVTAAEASASINLGWQLSNRSF